MALYETTFIARQDVSEADVEKLTEGFTTILTSKGGKIIKTEYWGNRKLSYEINKNKRGHYSLICSDSPSDALKEMERKMRLNEDVIRHLSVKVDEIEKEPSIVMTLEEEVEKK